MDYSRYEPMVYEVAVTKSNKLMEALLYPPTFETIHFLKPPSTPLPSEATVCGDSVLVEPIR